jgi:hypothetical protein
MLSVPWAQILITLALVGLEPPAPRSPGRYEVWLTAYDALSQPGAIVPMRAKLEHAGPWGSHFHMRGYPLRFTSPGLLDEESKTAEESTATVQLRVPSTGPTVCSVAVSFAGSARHDAARANSRVFVWPKNSAILITDVDHTISDLSELKIPFTATERIPALPGAVAALTELAARYRIVYLTARDEIFYEKTRAWLREKGFPEGPVFSRDFHVGAKQETFKQHFIAELKKRYPNVSVGVGDQPSDAHAYLNNGLKAFLIQPKASGTDAAPKGAIIVRSWEEVCRHLRGNGRRR